MKYLTTFSISMIIASNGRVLGNLLPDTYNLCPIWEYKTIFHNYITLAHIVLKYLYILSFGALERKRKGSRIRTE
jgi:hypothetical protein